jgi:hypothetical protein
MRAKLVFTGNRIGRGSDMSSDQAAFDGVFDALERTYGKGIFSRRNNNSIDVALQGDGDTFILTISTDLPVDKVDEFSQAVNTELKRAGLRKT